MFETFEEFCDFVIEKSRKKDRSTGRCGYKPNEDLTDEEKLCRWAYMEDSGIDLSEFISNSKLVDRLIDLHSECDERSRLDFYYLVLYKNLDEFEELWSKIERTSRWQLFENISSNENELIIQELQSQLLEKDEIINNLRKKLNEKNTGWLEEVIRSLD